jgi:hypothetical protein
MPIKPKEYYAYSIPGKPPEKWQLLEDHLKNVANLARQFAETFRWWGLGVCERIMK